MFTSAELCCERAGYAKSLSVLGDSKHLYSVYTRSRTAAKRKIVLRNSHSATERSLARSLTIARHSICSALIASVQCRGRKAVKLEGKGTGRICCWPSSRNPYTDSVASVRNSRRSGILATHAIQSRRFADRTLKIMTNRHRGRILSPTIRRNVRKFTRGSTFEIFTGR